MTEGISQPVVLIRTGGIGGLADRVQAAPRRHLHRHGQEQDPGDAPAQRGPAGGDRRRGAGGGPAAAGDAADRDAVDRPRGRSDRLFYVLSAQGVTMTFGRRPRRRPSARCCGAGRAVQLAGIHTVTSLGSTPVAMSGWLASSGAPEPARPAGRRRPGPVLASTTTSPLRKASTCSGRPSSHAAAHRRRARARGERPAPRGTSRTSTRPRGSWTSRAEAGPASGCGSQLRSDGPNPYDGWSGRPRDRHPAPVAASVLVTGPDPRRILAHGVRQLGGPRAGREPRPGRGRRCRAGRASRGVAARARRSPRTTSGWGSPTPMPLGSSVPAGKPKRVVCRSTSWLLSTHVVGAPTAPMASSDSSTTARRSRGRRHGVTR